MWDVRIRGGVIVKRGDAIFDARYEDDDSPWADDDDDEDGDAA